LVLFGSLPDPVHPADAGTKKQGIKVSGWLQSVTITSSTEGYYVSGQSLLSRTATTLMRRRKCKHRRTLPNWSDGTRAWVENLLRIWN